MLKAFNDLVNSVANVSSTKEKEALLRQGLTDNPSLKTLFELALSPYITYGIAKLPANTQQAPVLLTDSEATTESIRLLNELAQRRLTGKAAQAAISDHMSRLDNPAREAFMKILLKDLRANVSDTIVNKAKPGTVPVFSCQLALSEMPKLDELTFPILAEPKYDGVRTIAVGTKLFSRNGKDFENFEEIEAALTGIKGQVVLDGEILSPLGFQQLMNRTKAKRGVRTDVPIYYQVFDGMPLQNWQDQKCSIPLGQRRLSVTNMVQSLEHPLIRVTPGKLCHSVEEVEEFFAQCVADGFEGIMLKSPSGLYTFKRNKTWMKLKPFDTVDLKVVGVTEGKGKYSGMLGTLICTGQHGNKMVNTEVGSGFTDEDRRRYWADHSLVLGQIIEVRYQEITKSQDGDTYSLRFPTLVRFRGNEKI